MSSKRFIVQTTKNQKRRKTPLFENVDSFDSQDEALTAAQVLIRQGGIRYVSVLDTTPTKPHGGMSAWRLVNQFYFDNEDQKVIDSQGFLALRKLVGRERVIARTLPA